MTSIFHTLQRWSTALALVVFVACMGPAPAPNGGPSEPTEPGAPPPGYEDVQRVYRVQIGLYEQKSAAEVAVKDAIQWWQSIPRAEQPRPLQGLDELPVDVHWKPPYYRVRIGPFVERDRAERVLATTQSRFPDAFIAPERVGR